MRRLAYTIGYADKQIGEFLDILKAKQEALKCLSMSGIMQ